MSSETKTTKAIIFPGKKGQRMVEPKGRSEREVIHGWLDELPREKAVFILKIILETDRISHHAMMKALDLANALNWNEP